MLISFPWYTGSEILTNFPALVVLGGHVSNFAYCDIATNAWDLRFMNSNQTRQLSYEIESWNPSIGAGPDQSSSYIWVRVPLLSGTNTHIWARWGGCPSTNDVVVNTNSAVWSGDYSLVMHMAQTNGSAVLDATANERDGLISGGYAWQPAGGSIGGALRLTNSSADRITLAAPGVALSNNWSVEAWYKGQIGSTWRSLCGGDAGDEHLLIAAKGLLGTAIAPTNFYSSGYYPGILSEWRHVEAVGSSTTTQFYVNGTYRGTSYAKSTNSIRTVGNSTNSEKFADYLDEFRISSVARSPDWILASWLNQASNTSFVSYGTVEHIVVDADGDGMSDWWEILHFGGTNAVGGGAHEDKDDDGLSNLGEYLAGTNPTNDARSADMNVVLSNGFGIVRFQAVETQGEGYSGKQRFYDLEDCANVQTDTWKAIPGYTNIPGSNSIVAYTNSPESLSRFYRLRARLK